MAGPPLPLQVQNVNPATRRLAGRMWARISGRAHRGVSQDRARSRVFAHPFGGGRRVRAPVGWWRETPPWPTPGRGRGPPRCWQCTPRRNRPEQLTRAEDLRSAVWPGVNGGVMGHNHPRLRRRRVGGAVAMCAAVMLSAAAATGVAGAAVAGTAAPGSAAAVLSVPGAGAVRIVRDEYGVPHIFASTARAL